MQTPPSTWKDIPGAAQFEVNEQGQIRNKKTGCIRVLDCNKNGYYRLMVTQNGKHLRIAAHRAVALAFIPNPLNKPIVDHIDNDIKNNCLSNLRWATPCENALNTKLRNVPKSSKYKNISKAGSKFYWRITVNKLTHTSPKFATQEEAWEDFKTKVKDLSEYASIREMPQA